jgi:autotransporter strand-loop-strand O-heptosyltransferase
MYKNIKKISNVVRQLTPSINVNFMNGAFIELKNFDDQQYIVEFYSDSDLIYQSKIRNNMWSKTSKQYFNNWSIFIKNEKNDIIYKYELDLSGKKVLISLESSSLGDTLAWLPYVEEFRKKWNCKVIVSTFINNLFKGSYPELEFIEPGSVVSNIFAQYRIGWFYDESGEINLNMNPNNFRLQPMQKTASDILGLEYKEIKPKIKLKNVEKENIVSIAIHSTTQSKYWNNPEGWQEVVDYLNSKGYKVILISKEEDGYMSNFHPNGIEKLKNGPLECVIDTLQKSKLFIGVGSGLSWLSWAVGTKTCIISGFSYDYTEPIGYGIIRIKSPENVCSGCFNRHKLDPKDWNWCPDYKGTEKQFECSKSITGSHVIQKISRYIDTKFII